MIRLLPVLAVAVALALTPAAASADGDPASDVLLLQDVYLPYAPGVPPALGRTIAALLKTTRKYAVPISEYLDRIGLTVRTGDVRRLGPAWPLQPAPHLTSDSVSQRLTPDSRN